MLKQVLSFLLLFMLPVLLFAQQPDSILPKKDSIVKKDTVLSALSDTLLLKTDSIVKKDTIIHQSVSYSNTVQKLLKENQFLHWDGQPVAMVNKVKSRRSQESFFYLLATIAAILGFFRFFYTRYFNNLFRVFFNASLRQSQLTDQLLQAKLPSLLFNILFVLSGGVYVYFLLQYYGWILPERFWLMVFYCTLSLAIIYLIKFISLKFTGWLTGYKDITNTYVFIIFLINKILGILLIPFSVIIAFSTPTLVTVSVIISLLLIGLMFLLRFFRSYGLLQNQLKINGVHFFLYVVGIEIVPVLLIYKGLILLLSKNL
jgi:Domain of unknown function (DUF4271)